MVAGCTYEAAALTGRWMFDESWPIPPWTSICAKRPWLIPVMLTSLAAHFVAAALDQAASSPGVFPPLSVEGFPVAL